MNILWASNYKTQSGYSNQARLFVPRLARYGHQVTVFNLSSAGHMPEIVGGIQVVPIGQDPLGSDMMADYARKFKADAVITLIDAWGMNPDIMKQVPWFPLVPVDHDPVPPAVANSLTASVFPIAYSRYGEGKLKEAGFNPEYLPHAVDPDVWKPVDMATARRKLGIPDGAFLASFVGVNNDNPSRKGIPELLMAWSAFSRQHPDAILYLHTLRKGQMHHGPTRGVDIDALIKTFGIDKATIRLVDQTRYKSGIPSSELAMLASASDVFVLPTRGEGFGLPLLEFQRCGCPVITTDFAAGAELCFSGWLIEGEPEWSWQSATVMKPGIASIIEALQQAYEDRGNPDRRKKAIEGARDYDIDYVMQAHGKRVLYTIGQHALARQAQAG